MSNAFYAVINKNKNVLLNSSSGGAFYSLASYFINNLRGIVYASTIENGNVFYKRVNDVKEVFLLTKSKYVLSDVKNTFNECSDDLNNGLYVLYVGIPCQISALKSFLEYKKVKQDKLLTVDLFCHGVPQKSFWEKYLSEYFYGEKIIDVDFRYKKPSWENFSIKIKTDKRKYKKTCTSDPYMVSFLKNYILKESCYDCRFKGNNRPGDLSIGDFWGCRKYYPEFTNKNGVSLVSINNESKKQLILNILSLSCFIYPVFKSLSLEINPAYNSSAQKPLDFDPIRKSLIENGYKNTKLPTIHSNPFILFLKSFVKTILKKRKRIKGNNTVGIITDYGYWNYGNRLQNYALRKVLNDFGFTVVNLSNNIFETILFSKNLYNFFSDKRLDFGRRYKSIRKACLKSGEITIPYSYEEKNKSDIKKLQAIILGSDQIWNPNYNKEFLPFNLGLLCLDKKIKTISFAASFGVEKLSNSFNDLFKDAFNGMNAIGVRESSGKSIVNSFGFNAFLNVDPTLLLKKEDWDKAIKLYSTNKVPSEKYVLKYILGSDSILPAVNNFNYSFIDILNSKSPFYSSNHFDFVNLIKNAELIITDSFHAFVFSLLYGKKVCLLSRKNMNSRFSSLFKLLNIAFKENAVLDLAELSFDNLDKLIGESIMYLNTFLK